MEGLPVTPDANPVPMIKATGMGPNDMDSMLAGIGGMHSINHAQEHFLGSMYDSGSSFIDIQVTLIWPTDIPEVAELETSDYWACMTVMLWQAKRAEAVLHSCWPNMGITTTEVTLKMDGVVSAEVRFTLRG